MIRKDLATVQSAVAIATVTAVTHSYAPGPLRINKHNCMRSALHLLCMCESAYSEWSERRNVKERTVYIIIKHEKRKMPLDVLSR